MDWMEVFEEAGQCAQRGPCEPRDRLEAALLQPGKDDVAWVALEIMADPSSSPTVGRGRFASWAVERWIEARDRDGTLDETRQERLLRGLQEVAEASEAFRASAYYLCTLGPSCAPRGRSDFLYQEAIHTGRRASDRVEAARALGRIQHNSDLFRSWVLSGDPTEQLHAAVMLAEIDFRRAGGPAPFMDLLRQRGPGLGSEAARVAVRWLEATAGPDDLPLVQHIATHPDSAVRSVATALAARLGGHS